MTMPAKPKQEYEDCEIVRSVSVCQPPFPLIAVVGGAHRDEEDGEIDSWWDVYPVVAIEVKIVDKYSRNARGRGIEGSPSHKEMMEREWWFEGRQTKRNLLTISSYERDMESPTVLMETNEEDLFLSSNEVVYYGTPKEENRLREKAIERAKYMLIVREDREEYQAKLAREAAAAAPGSLFEAAAVAAATAAAGKV